MWSAFLTGAAKQATTLIEERDKEIRDNMNIRMNEMYKRAEVAKKEAEERRDELTGLANELVGAGFDEREAAYLLQNPEQARKIIAYADKTGGITATKKQQLFSKNKEHLNALEGETPQEYIKRVTTLGQSSRPLIELSETRGAFGLGSNAERNISEFLSTAGRTKEDLMATELPSREVKPLGLDMTAFAEPESDTDLKNQIRDIISRSEKTEDGIVSFKNETDQKEFDSISKKLAASAIVTAQFDFEDKKPRTASEIRSIFKDSIQAGLSPSIISGVAQVTASGDVVPITGDPDDISKFMRTRNGIIREVATNRGLIDPRTGEVVNEAAEDALTPYANIENGKIVGWKSSVPGGLGSKKPEGTGKEPTTPPQAASAKSIKLTDAQIDNITTDTNDRKALKFVRDTPNSPEAASVLSVLRTKYKDKLDGI